MIRAREPAVRVAVVVTFLRMDQRPAQPLPPLPAGAELRRLVPCTVAQYRRFYDGVGAPYVWWLRRAMSDRQLASVLEDDRVSVHVLTLDGEEAGFFELDSAPWPAVNLSYFGLLPHAVGRGLGRAFLERALDTAWRISWGGAGPECVTVNTCTADHPRALPTYQRAGFRIVRQVHEEWHVPLRLGLTIPEGLRVGHA